MRLARILTIAVSVAVATMPWAVEAQTRSARDTAATYGARLTAKEQSTTLVPNRINNRTNNRIDSRLSLRIERHSPANTANPAAGLQAKQDDRSRFVTGIDPLPQYEPQ